MLSISAVAQRWVMEANPVTTCQPAAGCTVVPQFVQGPLAMLLRGRNCIDPEAAAAKQHAGSVASSDACRPTLQQQLDSRQHQRCRTIGSYRQQPAPKQHHMGVDAAWKGSCSMRKFPCADRSKLEGWEYRAMLQLFGQSQIACWGDGRSAVVAGRQYGRPAVCWQCGQGCNQRCMVRLSLLVLSSWCLTAARS